MTNEKYILIKDKKNNKKSINSINFTGYNMNYKKGKTINGFNVDNLLIIKDDFIIKVIHKKIDKKFQKLFDSLLSIYESDDDPGTIITKSLNEVERFKRKVINDYLTYLNKKEIQKIEKKIKLIEQDIQSRMYEYQTYFETKEIEKEEEKITHRRR